MQELVEQKFLEYGVLGLHRQLIHQELLVFVVDGLILVETPLVLKELFDALLEVSVERNLVIELLDEYEELC